MDPIRTQSSGNALGASQIDVGAAAAAAAASVSVQIQTSPNDGVQIQTTPEAPVASASDAPNPSLIQTTTDIRSNLQSRYSAESDDFQNVIDAYNALETLIKSAALDPKSYFSEKSRHYNVDGGGKTATFRVMDGQRLGDMMNAVFSAVGRFGVTYQLALAAEEQKVRTAREIHDEDLPDDVKRKHEEDRKDLDKIGKKTAEAVMAFQQKILSGVQQLASDLVVQYVNEANNAVIQDIDAAIQNSWRGIGQEYSNEKTGDYDVNRAELKRDLRLFSESVATENAAQMVTFAKTMNRKINVDMLDIPKSQRDRIGVAQDDYFDQLDRIYKEIRNKTFFESANDPNRGLIHRDQGTDGIEGQFFDVDMGLFMSLREQLNSLQNLIRLALQVSTTIREKILDVAEKIGGHGRSEFGARSVGSTVDQMMEVEFSKQGTGFQVMQQYTVQYVQAMNDRIAAEKELDRYEKMRIDKIARLVFQVVFFAIAIAGGGVAAVALPGALAGLIFNGVLMGGMALSELVFAGIQRKVENEILEFNVPSVILNKQPYLENEAEIDVLEERLNNGRNAMDDARVRVDTHNATLADVQRQIIDKSEALASATGRIATDLQSQIDGLKAVRRQLVADKGDLVVANLSLSNQVFLDHVNHAQLLLRQTWIGGPTRNGQLEKRKNYNPDDVPIYLQNRGDGMLVWDGQSASSAVATRNRIFQALRTVIGIYKMRQDAVETVAAMIAEGPKVNAVNRMNRQIEAFMTLENQLYDLVQQELDMVKNAANQTVNKRKRLLEADLDLIKAGIEFGVQMVSGFGGPQGMGFSAAFSPVYGMMFEFGKQQWSPYAGRRAGYGNHAFDNAEEDWKTTWQVKTNTTTFTPPDPKTDPYSYVEWRDRSISQRLLREGVVDAESGIYWGTEKSTFKEVNYTLIAKLRREHNEIKTVRTMLMFIEKMMYDAMQGATRAATGVHVGSGWMSDMLSTVDNAMAARGAAFDKLVSELQSRVEASNARAQATMSLFTSAFAQGTSLAIGIFPTPPGAQLMRSYAARAYMQKFATSSVKAALNYGLHYATYNKHYVDPSELLATALSEDATAVNEAFAQASITQGKHVVRINLAEMDIVRTTRHGNLVANRAEFSRVKLDLERRFRAVKLLREIQIAMAAATQDVAERVSGVSSSKPIKEMLKLLQNFYSTDLGVANYAFEAVNNYVTSYNRRMNYIRTAFQETMTLALQTGINALWMKLNQSKPMSEMPEINPEGGNEAALTRKTALTDRSSYNWLRLLFQVNNWLNNLVYQLVFDFTWGLKDGDSDKYFKNQAHSAVDDRGVRLTERDGKPSAFRSTVDIENDLLTAQLIGGNARMMLDRLQMEIMWAMLGARAMTAFGKNVLGSFDSGLLSRVNSRVQGSERMRKWLLFTPEERGENGGVGDIIFGPARWLIRRNENQKPEYKAKMDSLRATMATTRYWRNHENVLSKKWWEGDKPEAGGDGDIRHFEERPLKMMGVMAVRSLDLAAKDIPAAIPAGKDYAKIREQFETFQRELGRYYGQNRELESGTVGARALTEMTKSVFVFQKRLLELSTTHVVKVADLKADKAKVGGAEMTQVLDAMTELDKLQRSAMALFASASQIQMRMLLLRMSALHTMIQVNPALSAVLEVEITELLRVIEVDFGHDGLAKAMEQSKAAFEGLAKIDEDPEMPQLKTQMDAAVGMRLAISEAAKQARDSEMKSVIGMTLNPKGHGIRVGFEKGVSALPGGLHLPLAQFLLGLGELPDYKGWRNRENFRTHGINNAQTVRNILTTFSQRTTLTNVAETVASLHFDRIKGDIDRIEAARYKRSIGKIGDLQKELEEYEHRFVDALFALTDMLENGNADLAADVLLKYLEKINAAGFTGFGGRLFQTLATFPNQDRIATLLAVAATRATADQRRLLLNGLSESQAEIARFTKDSIDSKPFRPLRLRFDQWFYSMLTPTVSPTFIKGETIYLENAKKMAARLDASLILSTATLEDLDRYLGASVSDYGRDGDATTAVDHVLKGLLNQRTLTPIQKVRRETTLALLAELFVRKGVTLPPALGRFQKTVADERRELTNWVTQPDVLDPTTARAEKLFSLTQSSPAVEQALFAHFSTAGVLNAAGVNLVQEGVAILSARVASKLNHGTRQDIQVMNRLVLRVFSGLALEEQRLWMEKLKFALTDAEMGEVATTWARRIGGTFFSTYQNAAVAAPVAGHKPEHIWTEIQIRQVSEHLATIDAARMGAVLNGDLVQKIADLAVRGLRLGISATNPLIETLITKTPAISPLLKEAMVSAVARTRTESGERMRPSVTPVVQKFWASVQDGVLANEWDAPAELLVASSLATQDRVDLFLLFYEKDPEGAIRLFDSWVRNHPDHAAELVAKLADDGRQEMILNRLFLELSTLTSARDSKMAVNVLRVLGDLEERLSEPALAHRADRKDQLVRIVGTQRAFQRLDPPLVGLPVSVQEWVVSTLKTPGAIEIQNDKATLSPKEKDALRMWLVAHISVNDQTGRLAMDLAIQKAFQALVMNDMEALTLGITAIEAELHQVTNPVQMSGLYSMLNMMKVVQAPLTISVLTGRFLAEIPESQLAAVLDQPIPGNAAKMPMAVLLSETLSDRMAQRLAQLLPTLNVGKSTVIGRLIPWLQDHPEDIQVAMAVSDAQLKQVTESRNAVNPHATVLRNQQKWDEYLQSRGALPQPFGEEVEAAWASLRQRALDPAERLDALRVVARDPNWVERMTPHVRLRDIGHLETARDSFLVENSIRSNGIATQIQLLIQSTLTRRANLWDRIRTLVGAAKGKESSGESCQNEIDGLSGVFSRLAADPKIAEWIKATPKAQGWLNAASDIWSPTTKRMVAMHDLLRAVGPPTSPNSMEIAANLLQEAIALREATARAINPSLPKLLIKPPVRLVAPQIVALAPQPSAIADRVIRALTGTSVHAASLNTEIDLATVVQDRSARIALWNNMNCSASFNSLTQNLLAGFPKDCLLERLLQASEGGDEITVAHQFLSRCHKEWTSGRSMREELWIKTGFYLLQKRVLTEATFLHQVMTVTQSAGEKGVVSALKVLKKMDQMTPEKGPIGAEGDYNVKLRRPYLVALMRIDGGAHLETILEHDPELLTEAIEAVPARFVERGADLNLMLRKTLDRWMDDDHTALLAFFSKLRLVNSKPLTTMITSVMARVVRSTFSASEYDPRAQTLKLATEHYADAKQGKMVRLWDAKFGNDAEKGFVQNMLMQIIVTNSLQNDANPTLLFELLTREVAKQDLHARTTIGRFMEVGKPLFFAARGTYADANKAITTANLHGLKRAWTGESRHWIQYLFHQPKGSVEHTVLIFAIRVLSAPNAVHKDAASILTNGLRNLNAKEWTTLLLGEGVTPIERRAWLSRFATNVVETQVLQIDLWMGELAAALRNADTMPGRSPEERSQLQDTLRALVEIFPKATQKTTEIMSRMGVDPKAIIALDTSSLRSLALALKTHRVPDVVAALRVQKQLSPSTYVRVLRELTKAAATVPGPKIPTVAWWIQSRGLANMSESELMDVVSGVPQMIDPMVVKDDLAANEAHATAVLESVRALQVGTVTAMSSPAIAATVATHFPLPGQAGEMESWIASHFPSDPPIFRREVTAILTLQHHIQAYAQSPTVETLARLVAHVNIPGNWAHFRSIMTFNVDGRFPTAAALTTALGQTPREEVSVLDRNVLETALVSAEANRAQRVEAAFRGFVDVTTLLSALVAA